MTSPTVTTIVFDLDGTLVDSSDAVVEAFNWALQQKGYQAAPAEDVIGTIGTPLPDMFASYVSPEQDRDEMVALFRDRFRLIYLKKSQLLPGVAGALSRLAAAGFVLGVATTKPRYFAEPILEHLGVLRYIATVAGAEEVERLKPAPDVLLLVLKRLGKTATEALYVGDRPLDVAAARAADIRVACVLTGHAREAAVRAARPDQVFPDLPALEAWLTSCT